MITAVAIVLALATFAFIGYPLFRQRPQPADSRPRGRRRELKPREELTDATLDDLEVDHQAGTLSDEDYREMKERLDRQTSPSAIDTNVSRAGARTKPRPAADRAPVEDEIEKRVAQMRKGKQAARPASVGYDSENRDEQMRKSKGRFCTKCGAGIDASDRFCTNCGAGVK